MLRPSRFFASVSLLLALALVPGVGITSAQSDLRKQLADRFQADLVGLAGNGSGVTGVSVVDLEDSQRFGVNDTATFAQGSAIKVAILIELFRRADAGDLKLTDRLPVRAADQVGGSGLLQYFADGQSELSLHDLAIPMIVLSDNTATNILIDRLGMDRISRTAAELGASHTRLQRKMIRPEESARGNENISTPRDAADLMVRISRCDLPMRKASCDALKRILEIPKSGSFREPIPAAVPVAWKPGGLDGVATAWGIVNLPGRPYAIAIMVNYGLADVDATVREISAAAYRYFSQLARATPYGTRVPVEYLKKP